MHKSAVDLRLVSRTETGVIALAWLYSAYSLFLFAIGLKSRRIPWFELIFLSAFWLPALLAYSLAGICSRLWARYVEHHV